MNTPPQGSPQTTPSAAILVALKTMSVPATFVVLIEAFTQHAWLTFLACILVDAIIWLYGNVLQQTLIWLAERASEWTKWQTQKAFSRYWKRYRKYLISEHQVVDVKGLSTRTAHDLELEDVFVELDIEPIAVHKASTNPIKIPENFRQGERTVWDYLVSAPLRQHHFVIIGAPGSGKTTLLKHIALTLMQHKKSRKRIRLSYKLPILLFLRQHANTVKENASFSLTEAVQDHIQKRWQQVIPPQWINDHLIKGRCLILLDGLDEIADPAGRKQMVEWVQRQMVAYGQNRFILTSRPYGYYNNPLEGVSVLETRLFIPRQIEQFIQNWYLANELKSWGKEDLGVHMRAREGAQDLLKRLHKTPALFALAVNPLLLTMIATVHRYRGSLPGKRVALYAEICEVFLGKRQEARGIAQELSPAQKQQVLQPLAYHLMREGQRDIVLSEAQRIIASYLSQVNANMLPGDFLQMIQDTSGLFVERDPDIYWFAHKTFQEYLAAVHIKEQGLEQVLISQIDNSWWHESIRLYCAQADATRILAACLAGDSISVARLTLAFACDEEKLKAQPIIKRNIDLLLTHGSEDENVERRHIIARALLARRIRQMPRLQEETYIDTSLISCAEYQVFLDNLQGTNSIHQPDHWTAYRFPAGQGQAPVLGVRPSDALAFCEWLTEHDLEGWSYRLPTSDDIAKMKQSNEQKDDFPEQSGYWANEGTTFFWAKGNPAVDGLQEQLADAFLKDYERLFQQPFSTTEPRQRDLAAKAAIIQKVGAARAYCHDLVGKLSSIRKQIRTNEQQLRHSLFNARTQTQELRTQLNISQRRIKSAENKLQEIKDQKKQLTYQLELITELRSNLEAALNGGKMVFFPQTMLLTSRNQENSDSEKLEVRSLQEELDETQRKEKKLSSDLTALDAQRTMTETELTEVRSRRKNLLLQFDLALQQAEELQARLDKFLSYASNFYLMCDTHLRFSPLYNRNQAFIDSLTRNNTLDFGSMHDIVQHMSLDESTFAPIPLFSIFANTFVKNLSQAITSQRINMTYCISATGNSTADEVAQLFELLDNPSQVPSGEYIQEVATTLKYYLEYLLAHRPIGKGQSLTRMVIRCFAKDLADHLSYWSWKELFVSPERPLFPSGKRKQTEGIEPHIIDSYLNIYVAFALLEERIEGHLPPHEGILLVKERRDQSL